MLLILLEKMRCKCLMRISNLYGGGVSQSNDDGYIPWGGWKCYIYFSKVVYLINQNYQRRRYKVAEQRVSILNLKIRVFNLGFM